MEEREPLLGVAIGGMGVGKTFLTKKLIQKYVQNNPQTGAIGRKVLIVDVNDEFSDIDGVRIKALRISDVKLFSVHQTVEIRRIRPFLDNGEAMTLRDLQETLFRVLKEFRGGLILIEDINLYVSDSLPQDIMGAICTIRHRDTDVIMHFQSIGRITPKVWQNLRWLRFHKINDSVYKHREKFSEKLEVLQLTESYINSEFEKGNERVNCYINFSKGGGKIMIPKEKLLPIIEEYLSNNYTELIKPLLKQHDLGKGVKMHTPAQAVKLQTERLLKKYYYQ